MSDLDQQFMIERFDRIEAYLRSEFREVRKEAAADNRRTRHDIRDELGGRIVKSELAIEKMLADQHEFARTADTGPAFKGVRERLTALERTKWIWHGFTAAVASAISLLGIKLTSGGGGG